jgi:hypothetical protein
MKEGQAAAFIACQHGPYISSWLLQVALRSLL